MANYRILLILCIHILITLINSNPCPRKCSGHGQCDPRTLSCLCDAPYNASADCSRLSCPYSLAWVGKAMNSTTPSSLTPHGTYVECSNKGSCNRNTGKCKCFDGFEGIACQRLKCDCVFGRCMTIDELYKLVNYNDLSLEYISWDKTSTTSCVCDYGYTGTSCELRMCPKGVDSFIPATSHYFTLNITVSGYGGVLTGALGFAFQGFSFTFPANGNQWNGTTCKAAFDLLPNIGSVSCVQSAIDWTGSSTYEVQFLSFPSLPVENNIYTNNGTPSANSFRCDLLNAGGAYDVQCSIDTIINENHPKYSYCSNRGTCDFNSGQCSCLPNFSGLDCSLYSTSARELVSSNSDDTLIIESEDFPGPYSETILHVVNNISTTRTLGNVDYILGTNSAKQKVFAVTGQGNFDLYNGTVLIEEGGITIQHGGLQVTGGLSILAGGLSIPLGGITIQSGGLAILANGLQVNGYDGLNILQNATSITGGLTITSTSTKIISGGLQVENIGASILSGGINVGGSGMTIVGIGLTIEGGMSINSRGLSLSKLSVTSTGLLAKEGISIGMGGAFITDGVFVDGGSSIINGVTVQSGDIQVDSMSVQSGGVYMQSSTLQVDNGANVISGGITVPTSGISVFLGGLVVSGGITTSSVLLHTDSSSSFDGITISNGNMTISSSFPSSISNGMIINGQLSNPSSSISIVSGGLVAYNGITIPLGYGMQVSNGITVSGSGNSYVFGSGQVASKGLQVANSLFYPSNTGIAYTGSGLTIGNTLTVSNGMSVASGGVVIPIQGLTISDTGLVVSGGLTISRGGLYANNGLIYQDPLGLNLPTASISVNSAAVGLTFPNINPTQKLIINGGGLNIGGSFLTLSSSASQILITGGLSITAPGSMLTITNTLTSAGSLSVANGITIGTGGMAMSSGSLSIQQDGMIISQGGMTVNSQLNINGPLSIYGGNLQMGAAGAAITVSGGSTYFGILKTNAPQTINGNFLLQQGSLNVRNSMSVFSGLYLSNTPSSAMTIAGNSLNVISGGVTVGGGGLYATSGLTVSSLGIFASGGGIVASSSMVVSGGLTIGTSGAVISSGALVLGVNGASIIGNIAPIALGLSVTNGLTLNNGGVVVSGGLTIASGNIVIGNGYMSVLAGGLSIAAGGVTIRSEGFSATSLQLTGGLTSPLIGLSLTGPTIITSGGMTVQSGGFNIQGGGISIFNGGLFVSNGLSVQQQVYLQTAPVILSDERLKENFENITNSLVKVSKIRGVYYHWKVKETLHDINTSMEEEILMKQRQVGVLAQEILKVFPEAIEKMKLSTTSSFVIDENEEYLGVRYNELIPFLIVSIQELNKRIQVLTTKNNIQIRINNLREEYHKLLKVLLK